MSVLTLSYGSWQPDLANVAYQTLQMAIPITVPLADCLNVRYVNGVYQALPTAVAVAGSPNLGSQCLGAMTLIDATGSALPIAGGPGLTCYFWSGGAWNGFAPGFVSVGGVITNWNFCQFGNEGFAQVVPSSFGALNTFGVGNLFSFTPQGIASPVQGAPLGTVLAVVGQFVMVGDIAASQPIVEVGAGNGSTVTFTATLPNAPLYPGAQSVSLAQGGYSGTMSAGEVGSPVAQIGFISSSIGSISPSTDAGGNTISALYVLVHNPLPTKLYLQINSASALGASYFQNITLSGTGADVTLAATAAVYSFSGGVNTWEWIGVDALFVNTDTYAVSYPNNLLSPNIQGYDNGAGAFLPAAVSTFSSGTINYDTGAVSLTFASAPASGVDVYVNSSYAARARLQWSAIGNGDNWPVPLTQSAYALQAGMDDLEYAYGPVMGIAGYELYAVILQRNALTRANYIGGNVVFSWGTYSRNLGLIAKGAWIQVGGNVYFLSDQGFFSTDGSGVYPIGTAANNSSGIDQWFWSNVNKAALGAIRTGYDALARNIQFAIPTGSNTLPDTLLCYNIISSQWTKGALPTSFIWTDSDGSTDRLGVFDQSNNYSRLTGAPNTGYCESLDIQFADGMPRTTTAARPMVAGSSPTVTLATRNTLEASPVYSAAVAPDAFAAGYAGVIAQGLYTRVRVSSSNAQSIQGAQLQQQLAGGV